MFSSFLFFGVFCFLFCCFLFFVFCFPHFPLPGKRWPGNPIQPKAGKIGRCKRPGRDRRPGHYSSQRPCDRASHPRSQHYKRVTYVPSTWWDQTSEAQHVGRHGTNATMSAPSTHFSSSVINAAGNVLEQIVLTSVWKSI